MFVGLLCLCFVFLAAFGVGGDCGTCLSGVSSEVLGAEGAVGRASSDTSSVSVLKAFETPMGAGVGAGLGGDAVTVVGV